MPNAQARYWMLTIPAADWSPPTTLPPGISYMRGQKETASTGYLHWQLIAYYAAKIRMSSVKASFCPTAHCEATRSDACLAYVWKEETRIEGTQFELGELASSNLRTKPDWQNIWTKAKGGLVDEIPPDVAIRYYGNLKKIFSDNQMPQALVRTAVVYWGPTRYGKSRRAWSEATFDPHTTYCKDPRTKFWCGYRGQKHVVIDEFRGAIDIANILRWTDRYPLSLEIKGSSVPSTVEKFWFTSNIPPEQWYPDTDPATMAALLARLEVIEFTEPWVPPPETPDPLPAVLAVRDDLTNMLEQLDRNITSPWQNRSVSPEPLHDAEEINNLRTLIDFTDYLESDGY